MGLAALAIVILPVTWATLLIVGSIVVVVTLVRPQIGVLLLVPAVPFGSIRQVTVGAMNVGVTEALMALILAAWFMRLVVRRKIRILWPPLSLLLLLFLGALLLSLIGASSLQHSLKEIIKWVEVLILYLFVVNELSGRWIKALILVILGTGTLAALHGIYQFLFQVGPEGFILFDRFMRAYGTFEQPNPYAGYLGLTLPLAMGLMAAGIVRVKKRVSGAWWLWAAGSGMLMLAAMIMSWSRGAWIGFGTAVVAMGAAVLARSGRAAILIVVLVVLIFYGLVAEGNVLIPSSFLQRFSDFIPYLGVVDVRGKEITDANFAVLERMAHWQAALAMWADHPWFGVGIGNYEVVYARYALPMWPLPLGHAHNYYLNIGAEAGTVGLGAYLLLWSVALVIAWRSTRRTQGWEWAVSLGVFGALVHLCVHNLFDNLFVHAMYLHVAVLLGIRLGDMTENSGAIGHGMGSEAISMGGGGPH